MSDFEKYLVPGTKGHLIGIGGVSMSPLAEVQPGCPLVTRAQSPLHPAGTVPLWTLPVPQNSHISRAVRSRSVVSDSVTP